LYPSKRLKIDKIWLIVGIGVAIRFIFLGMMNLLPEEAYYWNYARHLDIGYLDHPPMVAWLIYISDMILGRSEFAVRLPAFLAWLVLSLFMYKLAENMVGKGTGKTVVLLLAVLPIYMSVGFLMTPDAPLYMFWAGAMFFLARAIFGNRVYAWYGAGICLGLGLLSKYTIGLIVPATLVFLLVDKDSRSWLKSPHPYLALIIGLIMFSPVIYWNAYHEWVSFAFQTTRRWSGGIDFNLHTLIASVFVLITPLGVYEAIRVFLDLRKGRSGSHVEHWLRHRKFLFLATFTLVPLSVFVFHSIQGQPKLNWTGPVWLAILPLIAARISGAKIWDSELKTRRLAKRWIVASSALLLIFAAGFGYMVSGMSGIVKVGDMKLPVAWKAFGDRVEEIESEFELGARTEPIIIGLDKYWLASEATFYDDEDGDSLTEAGSEGLVGGNGLMWNSWVVPEMADGRDGVLVSLVEDKLRQAEVTRRFSELGDITKEVLTNRYGEIGIFYWRIGYHYHPE
jgi:dolichol-phosphate mannosyltransferase